MSRGTVLACVVLNIVHMLLHMQWTIVGSGSNACMCSLACRGRVSLHDLLLQCCCSSTRSMMLVRLLQ